MIFYVLWALTIGVAFFWAIYTARQRFLGTGSVDGKNVFNYVTEDGGYSTLRQADADQSSIWQDEDEDPYLDVSRIAWRVDWAIPTPIFSTLRYDFHIPDGSVYNGYSVQP